MTSTSSDFDFNLPDTNGTRHSPDGEIASVVIFVSNRSPDWAAWMARVVAIAGEYAARGVRFLAINTPISFPTTKPTFTLPTDDMEGMRAALQARDWGEITYLFDPSQATARSYGAVVAPDVFVLDSDLRLRYRGLIGEHYETAEDDGVWLRAALEALLDGREPANGGGHSVGVPIKWTPLPIAGGLA